MSVAAFLLCGGYYRLVRVILDDLQGLARHTGGLRLIGYCIQNRMACSRACLEYSSKAAVIRFSREAGTS